MGLNQARRRLAKIRCVLETAKALKDGRDLPESLCFVPQDIEYRISHDHLEQVLKSSDGRISVDKKFIIIKAEPSSSGREIGKLPLSADLRINVSGLEFSNTEGDWIHILEGSLKRLLPTVDKATTGWILVQPREAKGEQLPVLVPWFEVEEALLKSKHQKESLFDGAQIQTKTNLKKGIVYRWENVVEESYMLSMHRSTLPSNVDVECTRILSHTPINWGIEEDEELVQFLVKSLSGPDYCTVDASKYIESVEVSTEQDAAHYLLDDDPDTYWESDGSQGRHYIRLTIKPGVIVKQLLVGVDENDDNYMPNRILVYGKDDHGTLKHLNDTTISSTFSGDVCVLENMTEFYKLIEIRIRECKENGIDCRIHSIKIVSSKQKQAGLNKDLFNGDLVRFPKLDAADKECLYRRSLMLLRFMALFDAVINYLLPFWDYTAGTFKNLEVVRQFLPLSRKVGGLIDHYLRESETPGPSSTPKIFVNRHLAAEHLVNPSQDPEAKYSIFTQLYEALRPERCEAKLDFRWSQKYDQWWECKFIGEGIIDQGGGFRDSLADLGEELCPSSPDTPLPLPFFIRSPNQMEDTSNVYRDGYIPNPACKQFMKYEWIGQVMGACLRGRERLVLSLPSYVWKCVLGEKTCWSKDYVTVDAAEVKLHEELQTIDKESFNKKYYGNLTFVTVLSGNIEYQLKPGGSDKLVTFDDIPEYLAIIQKARLGEFAKQVAAIRRGLLKSIPKAVMELLTWQELERRICGDSVISIDSLKKMIRYEDLEERHDAVKYLWQSLENFTNEDRSRFLRFVTGRRRLPASFYVVRSRSSSSSVDSLPESATCSSTLFLPTYSSAKVAEEKIKYAIYNCVAIDADMSPWED